MKATTFAGDGVTPVLSAPGMPLMVSAVEFNRVASELLEAKQKAKLYEKLRKLNPRQFAELNAKHLAGAGAFDELVNQLP